MNIFILIIILIFSVSTAPEQEHDISGTGFAIYNIFTTSGDCPNPNEINKSIVEDFLSKPEWAEQRMAANIGSISVSQVTVLTDSNDGSICSSFNETYQGFFEEENGIGEPAYNITYYKAGIFYFVVITIRQSDDPDYVGFGVSYITISDQNLNLIKGYAF